MLLVGVAVGATYGYPQNCVMYDTPPLPNAMSNVRLIGCAAAANATPLPAVRSRTSKILLRDTPRAAPVTTLHLISARRVSSRFSSRLEVWDLAMVVFLTRRCRRQPS